MTVTVSTPSRLHFGLLRFEQADGLSYGGLGMMIAEPRWIVELDASDQWAGEGPAFQRALEFARRVLDRTEASDKPQALRLRVLRSVQQHHGFGGGTQLGLAIAAGIRRLLELPAGTAAELATLAGRGMRSAVGAHGFVQGGLIWETGREPGDALGRLAARIELPESWRIVLVDTGQSTGLSGKPEIDAFSGLPPVPQAITDELQRITESVILPAAKSAKLEDFGQGVYEYGRLAGECFAPAQGGAYASPGIARCVRTIRQFGVPGAGQSSWGPTVFAVTENQGGAEQLRQLLAENASTREYDVQITSPDNRGADVDDT